MRRCILLVSLVVAGAAPIVAVLPAKAVSTSCARPMAISSAGHAGASYSADTTVDTHENGATAKVCVRTSSGARDVTVGHQQYRYDTDGMGGGWVVACDGSGSSKKCSSVGALWNGGVWTSPDVAAMSVTPSQCDSNASSSYGHCWAVLAGAYVDGPLGSSSGVGAGACVAEVNEFGVNCLVEVPPTIP